MRNEEKVSGGERVNGNNLKTRKMREYRGIAASPGISIGTAFIYDETSIWVEDRVIAPDQVEPEKTRFRNAIRDVVRDIRELKLNLEKRVGKQDASIFDPHIMLLEDPEVIRGTTDLIDQGKSAEFAFFKVTRKILKIYKNLEDPYLRQRADDISDILRRVTTKLQGKEFAVLASIDHPVIVVAPNLSPSDTANMHSGNVLAFVTQLGGLTSHATILARSMGIPAVLGIRRVASEIAPGETIIVDGIEGTVIANPDDATLEQYRQRKRELEEIRESLATLRELPAITLDGTALKLMANIEFPEEFTSVLENGAAGVGLFRSEYQFLKEDRMPTEEELFTDYDRVAAALAPKPIIIRTFDLGGDKISHIVQTQPEENPFLGWRAIRVSLALKDVFKVHLRAILRSSTRRNVKVMFPMISSMEELDESLACVEEVKEDLRRDRIPFDEHIPVGIMIEIPAAVMIANHLAEKAAFFSIGTNDLIQYSVAVDRTNDRIAKLFEPFHPGVLQMIQMTIDAGHAHGIKVAVCGEVSNDPLAALVLLGMGIDELSMAPRYVPSIKSLIRRVTTEDAQQLARAILSVASAKEAKEHIELTIRKLNLHIT